MTRTDTLFPFTTLVRSGLWAVVARGAVATGLVYGARVLAQLQAMVGVQGLQWMALLAGCLGLSWSLDRLRRPAGPDGLPRPACSRRPAERSGGQEWARTCRSRWSP